MQAFWKFRKLPAVVGGLIVGFGLGGCVGQLPEADFALTLRRGGEPWHDATVFVQPLDRRNFPVNPLELSATVDYLSRPAPEAVVAGRTDSGGRIRIRTIASLTTQLCVMGAAGGYAVVLLEPVEDAAADGDWVLHPLVHQEAGEPRVEVEIRPAESPH